MGFKSVDVEVMVEGFQCCHLPWTGDHSDRDRYSAYRPSEIGLVLLHGHVHEAWKMRGRMLNVGVDVWDYAPVSLEEVREFIAGAGMQEI